MEGTGTAHTSLAGLAMSEKAGTDILAVLDGSEAVDEDGLGGRGRKLRRRFVGTGTGVGKRETGA